MKKRFLSNTTDAVNHIFGHLLVKKVSHFDIPIEISTINKNRMKSLLEWVSSTHFGISFDPPVQF